MLTEQAIAQRYGIDTDVYDVRIKSTWGSEDKPQHSFELVPKPIDAKVVFADYRRLSKGLKPLKSADPEGAHSFGLLALSDLHFGQDYEGGVEAQVRRAMELGVTLIDEMLAHPRWNVGHVGLLFNGDTSHVDNVRGTTTRGTPLEDFGTDYPTMYRTVFAGLVGLTNWVARRRRVTLFKVGGNHDFHVSFHLGEQLEVAYSDTDRVEIRGGMDKFMYHRWGRNLLLFSHGDTQMKTASLKELMAEEQPEMWGATTHRYAFTGHHHTPGRVKNHFHLPALVDRGNHAKNQGYVPQMQGAAGFVFHPEDGLIGQVGRSW